jgi:hypothetical protein
MSTYCFKGKGAALPYDSMFAVLRKHIDLAALVAEDYGKLALASAPTVSLSSFAGFVQNDILEVFEVPAGTLIIGSGINITTGDGATSAVEMGNNSADQTALVVAGSADPNAYGTFDLVSALTLSIPQIALDGTAENFADVFVTDGSIDLKFTTSLTYDTAIFDIWAVIARAFEPESSS